MREGNAILSELTVIYADKPTHKVGFFVLIKATMAEHEIPDWNAFCLRSVGHQPSAAPMLSEQDKQLIDLIHSTPDLRKLPRLEDAPATQLFRIITALHDKWPTCGSTPILEMIELLYFETHVSILDLHVRIPWTRQGLEDLVVKLVLT